MIPVFNKPLFEFRFPFRIKVPEKTADGRFLLFAQVFQRIGEGCLFLDVSEQLGGISQVLVYVVEIGEEHFPPQVKRVERFVSTTHLKVDAIQSGHQRQGIGYLQVSLAPEQVLNR